MSDLTLPVFCRTIYSQVTRPACPDEEFIQKFSALGPSELARYLGIDVRRVYSRRRNLEKKYTIVMPASQEYTRSYPARMPFKIESGVILIGSDAHYWPGIVTTAHRAFVRLVSELQPKAVILNGDVYDGAKLSRHPPLGWEQKPTPKQEAEAVDARLEEIRREAKGAELFWTMGNHCARFEARLAAQSPEYEGMPGFALKDHFPAWKHALSLWINDDVVVKHRFKGGVHATHNNTLYAGRSIVTGHLHSLKVTPFADYNGNRFGVDTGTLANPYGPQFTYSEDNPINHRSGFIVLTFHNGKLLWPEIVHVIDENSFEFRGQVLAA